MRDSWDNMFEEVPASFEARMKETLSALEEKPKIRRFRFGTGALVAAALLVAVLGGTALATDFFGLKSLTVTDPNASPAAVSATAEPVSDSTVIALQGVPGSPEFKANAEWMDFLASYDTTAMAKETAACLPEKYDLYSVSTQDMANELDQITRKYNLRLHTSVTDFDSEDTLYSLLNAEPFLHRRERIYLRGRLLPGLRHERFRQELRISAWPVRQGRVLRGHAEHRQRRGL